MAEFQAYTNWDYRLSDVDRFHVAGFGSGWITSVKSRSGSYSLCIPQGCSQGIWYGCDAGEKTISVYCWKPSGASAALEVVDPDSGDTIARVEATQSETWEKLEMRFEAEKKVYIIRLRNTSIWWGVGKVYFDDLE